MTTSPARYALPPHGTSGARAVTPRRREAKPAAGALYSTAGGSLPPVVTPSRGGVAVAPGANTHR
jgi:hypothetical protein